MLELSLITLVILLFLLRYMVRDSLHPAIVYTGVWLFQLSGLFIFRDRFVEVSGNALLLVVLGAIMFVAGSLIPLHYNQKKFNRGEIDRGDFRVLRKEYTVYLIFVFLVGVSAIMEYRIFGQNGGDFAASLVANRRKISIFNEDIYGIYKYAFSLSLSALLSLEMLAYRGRATLLHKAMGIYFFGACLFLGTLTTGRGPILTVLMTVLINYIVLSRVDVRSNGSSIKKYIAVLISVLLMCGIFWFMGMAMGKVGEDIDSLVSVSIEYLFSSIPVLSVYLSEYPLYYMHGDYGANTFRFFFAIAARFGLTSPPSNLVQEFVRVPHMANLYTTYFNYYKDFGVFGIFLIPFIVGCIHGYLYNKAAFRRENEFLHLFAVVLYIPLVMSVFQESYIISLSIWIQYFVLGIILSRRVKATDL